MDRGSNHREGEKDREAGSGKGTWEGPTPSALGQQAPLAGFSGNPAPPTETQISDLKPSDNNPHEAMLLRHPMSMAERLEARA